MAYSGLEIIQKNLHIKEIELYLTFPTYRYDSFMELISKSKCLEVYVYTNHRQDATQGNF